MLTAKTQQLTESDFDAAVAEGVTVVDFYADWCGPCRMLAPVLDELSASLQGRARVAKVDLDTAPGLAARFRVQAIPLVVILQNGREVDRLVGLQTRQSLQEAVQRVL